MTMIAEKFNPRTIASMEVALERVCVNISGGEKHEVRKFIANRITRCATKGNLTLDALCQAGQTAATELGNRSVHSIKILNERRIGYIEEHGSKHRPTQLSQFR